MTLIHQRITKQLSSYLNEDNIIHLRRKVFDEFNRKRDNVKKRFKIADLEGKVRAVKEYSIDHIHELVGLAKENLESVDAHVTIANTAQDARRAALEIIENDHVVVQSSTDLPIEVDLDQALIAQGQQSITTEAYCRVYQIAEKVTGFNKGYPLRYLSANDLGDIIRSKIDPSASNDPDKLTQILVNDINKSVKTARVGLTGANAISAKFGSIVLTFGLGNIFKVIQRPIHLVMVGIDKIVPSYLDAWMVTYLESLYSSGLGGSAYQVMVRGPSWAIDVAGTPTKTHMTSKEVHVILLDNGRSDAIKNGFKEAFYCIRCFTCHNYCPAYTTLGPGKGFDFRIPGFGYKGYIGGRGIILAACLFGLPKAIEAGLFACTLCGVCKTTCPMNINIPDMIRAIKSKSL